MHPHDLRLTIATTSNLYDSFQPSFLTLILNF